MLHLNFDLYNRNPLISLIRDKDRIAATADNAGQCINDVVQEVLHFIGNFQG